MLKRYVVFTKPYLLIEDINNTYQPFYKEYEKEKIPSLYLKSPILCCPFLKNKRFKSNKNRKTKNGGFCENCYVKYLNYDEHVKERNHREFALDSRNYKEIDEIIDSFNIQPFDPDLYCPVSPLMYKSASLPVFDTLENDKDLDTIVFTNVESETSENLYNAVYKVEHFLNEYLNE
ncbi:putative DNA replication protein kinase [Pseudoloma neurophilia]|uniref:Putative DNA replication protein kinase n=1 Tax=Pseudoloma neurophilia TaxID=146866 RepID=A0A0R0LZX9_9MICR|nr:putative DNA replication protein kinase [Pseudoloma neurophilia]